MVLSRNISCDDYSILKLSGFDQLDNNGYCIKYTVYHKICATFNLQYC